MENKFECDLSNLDKNHVEKARIIIITKLQAFIQKIKNEKQPFEIEREDALKFSFEAKEIEDCFSLMAQELSIVEKTPFFSLEWKISIPLSAHGQNFFGKYFNVRKLDLIESVINSCFGSTVCKGSFQPTMTAIDNHVPGKVRIEGINQIVRMYSESVTVHVEEEKNISINKHTVS